MSGRDTIRGNGASHDLERRQPRAIRGLIGVFALSLLNLLGAFLLITALGGLAPWTAWQFIGLFGLLESGMALALVVAPNAWRLPVEHATRSAGARLDRRLFAPRWGALVKLATGLAMVSLAAMRTGVGPETPGVIAVAAAIGLVVFSASLAAARFGVARPDLDVYQIVVRRPGRPDLELPGISGSALVLQFVLNVAVIPTVKFLPPDAIFDPELGTSPGASLAVLAAAVAATVLALGLWRGRIGRRPAEPDDPRSVNGSSGSTGDPAPGLDRIAGTAGRRSAPPGRGRHDQPWS